MCVEYVMLLTQCYTLLEYDEMSTWTSQTVCVHYNIQYVECTRRVNECVSECNENEYRGTDA